MSIADEFTRLQTLHASGTLTDDEFAAAKEKVLAADAPTADMGMLRLEVQRVKIQNEIIRLDQDWDVLRENYMFHGRYGSRSVPTMNASIGGAIGLIVIGLFCLMLDRILPTGGFWTFLGVCTIIGGIWGGIYGYNKTLAYEQAYMKYRQQREELTEQLRQ